VIRPGFLSSADRLEREACVRRQREDHGIARRANAILRNRSIDLAVTHKSCGKLIHPADFALSE
jgi:hypothetical protein